ncbi:MAG TPA: alanine racemase [Longimicrobiales bacterium]|nr:alanine racemase [Longimicrobiales bacterium]
MSNDLQARAWVEVDLDALRDNYRAVREAVGARPAIIAMVKADAYGLGADRVVRALEPLEPWGYGVATADEGAALRDFGVRRPIVVFGPLPPAAIDTAARAGLSATISDLTSLEQWASAATGGQLDFHVEIDTGMGRAGFDWRDTPSWSRAVHEIATVGRVRWTGVMTHFHGADGADATASAVQWERFQDALAQLPVPRSELMVHAANSAAAIRWPEYAADAVRPGIFLYGGHPAKDAGEPVTGPRPVAAVRARLVLVRDVAPGSTAGYGATHVARQRERWGTLAIGYGDGLPRRLGNRGSAIVRGRVVPFVGRISMDMTVVDITAVPDAQAGDVVTLIGSDGDATISLDDFAAQADTISYEILTGLRPRLPRVEKGA